MRYESKKRHGDMLFIRLTDEKFNEGVENKKATTKIEKNNLVVGLGETTGHEHVVSKFDDGKIIEYANSNKGNDLERDEPIFFEVSGAPAVVHHEDHNTITLEKGKWTRVYQKSVDPFSKKRRAVLD